MNRFSFLLLLFLMAVPIQAGFISQTNIFSDEVASNLTSGAPLVVSSTGKITTGINFNIIPFTATITTTSTSDVLMTGMTTTPAAGTWDVLFCTWFTHSNGNATITYSIHSGASQIAGSVMTVIPFVGALSAITQDIPGCTSYITAVNGSQAISIEWHTSTGTGSAHTGFLKTVRLQ